LKLSKGNIWLKVFGVTLLASALAAFLGFFGTHYILSNFFEGEMSKEMRKERLVQSVGRNMRLVSEQSKLSYEKLVENFNESNKDDIFQVELKNKIDVPDLIKPLPVDEYKTDFTEGKKKSYYRFNDNEFLVLFHNPKGEHGPPPMGFKGGPGKPSFFLIPVILTFVIMLLVLFIVAASLVWFSRKYADSAKSILKELKKGNLKARFPVEDFNELNEVKVEFNLMADEIESLITNLREVDQLRKSLLQELAHDLRTPIASMKSLLEVNQFHDEKLSSEDRVQNIKLALRENEYFHHLVEDLLFLSGVNDFKYQGKFRDVNLNELISHEVAVMESHYPKLNLVLINTNLVSVKGDYHLLQRLIRNSLSNAISHAKNEVMVQIKEFNNTVEVSIVDDGVGLSLEDIDAFGKKRITRKYDVYSDGRISIGLGAVIMAKISELHHADMKIDNLKNNYGEIIGASLIFKFNR